MTMTDNVYLATALRAMHAGISVLPPRQDGSKRPLSAWKHHQEHPADEETIRDWYANGRTGVGVVPGAVSGGLELFEFDEPTIAHAFITAADRAGLGDLVERIIGGYCERTPGGGVHWFWRCSEVGGNTKLARRPEPTDDNPLGVKVLIETRGEGGFAIVAPSNGRVHPSGGAYTMVAGGWESVTVITPDERRAIFDLARSFDEMPRRAASEQFDSKVSPGSRPGDWFASRTSWPEILEPAGWRFVYEHDGVSYWRRPGKTWGISASTNYGGSDLFYVFSSSTVFEPEESYTKFGAWTQLNHGGDFSAASRAILDQQPGGVLVTHLSEAIAEAIEQDTSGATETKRRYEIIPAPQFVLRPPQRWLVSGVIPERSYCCIAGQPESFKSFVAIELGLSIACGRPFLGWRCKQGNVLYICAEGQGGFARRLLAWQKARGVPLPDAFKVLPSAVPLLDVEAVKDLVLAAHDLSESYRAIIIDTVSQSIPGANENASETMTGVNAAAQALMAAFGCTVTLIHHGNRAGGMIRGHSSLDGALDTIIEVEADRDAGIVTVSPGKQKDGERFDKVYLRREVVDLTDILPPPPDLEPDEEWKPSSVVLQPMSSHEQQIRRGEVVARSLSAGQRKALRVLWTAGGERGATHGQWWDEAKRAGYEQRHREPFKKQQRALVDKGMVSIRAGSDVVRYVPLETTPQLLANFDAVPGIEEETPNVE